MTNKKRVNVTIDGRNFAIVGNEEEEYIKMLAQYVDKRIRSLASKNDKLSQTMSATLAALHIADEFYKANESYSELEHRAKDPLEKYDTVCENLRKAETKIESYEKICAEYQEAVSEHSRGKDTLKKEVDKYKEIIESKDLELEELKDKIKSLQDKNYENQLEIIEIKRELAEYLKLLDRETSLT